MDIESVVRKSGKSWTQEEKQTVFDELDREGFFDELVQFAYRRTFPYGLSNGFDLAKDVVATKLMDAFRYLDTYDPSQYKGKKCPFRNWLYVMVARAIGRAAWKELKKKTPRPPKPPVKKRLPRLRPDPKIEWPEAEPYVDLLSPKYRQAVELCDKHGLSQTEAAEQAGCKKGALKVRLFRARQTLRCIMTYVGQLPVDTRRAFNLCSLQKKLSADAARLMNVSESRVKALLHDALSGLPRPGERR